jgi:hypothetical protein
MALPADHVAPRAYQDGIDAIRDQIAAHAAYLGIAAHCLRDHPVDPSDDEDRDLIEIHSGDEIEAFADGGHPRSPETEAEVILVLRASRGHGAPGPGGPSYRAPLMDLRDKVRAVLLQDPDYDGPQITGIRSTPLWDGGKLVTGVLTMTLTVMPYVTEYPPAGLPAFTTVGLTVDGIDPADPNAVGAGDAGPDGRPEAEGDIDLPQE